MARNVKPDDRGFTIIVVLWIITLLTLILIGFLRSASTHTRIAGNTVSSARAEALADAGVYLALLDLLAAADGNTLNTKLPLNALRACRNSPGETVSFLIEDTGGRVDINAASQPLLAALLAGLGNGPNEANSGAAAIIDYRDHDNDTLAGGAEARDYAAAGLTYAPKNARFDTVEELESVLGFGYERTKALLPFVTVHSGLTGIDPATASPRLLAVLRHGETALNPGATGLSAQSQSGFYASSSRQFFIVSSTAEIADGSQFVREVVVELSGRRSRIFALRSWKRSDVSMPRAGNRAELPPCRTFTG